MFRNELYELQELYEFTMAGLNIEFSSQWFVAASAIDDL